MGTCESFWKKINGYKIPNCFPKIFKLVILNSKMIKKNLKQIENDMFWRKF
jgi:hypothetical protein